MSFTAQTTSEEAEVWKDEPACQQAESSCHDDEAVAVLHCEAEVGSLMEPLLMQADVHVRALCLAVMWGKVREDSDIAAAGDLSCESVRCAAAAPLAVGPSDRALHDKDREMMDEDVQGRR